MNTKLIELLNNIPEQGIHVIKLKDLLNLRSEGALTREIRTAFPATTIGSVTLVDQIVLLCLDELVLPDVILEIGTFQGFTTRLLVLNSAATHIYSIDLPHTDMIRQTLPEPKLIFTDGNYNDDYLRDIQNLSGEIYLKDIEPENFNRISLVKGDSTKIDFAALFGNVDFAFIDGGHQYDIVRSDTENVLKVMSRGVIVWHDYNSNIHSDVTRYLCERALGHRIIHVAGSLCAFELIGI